MSKKQGLYLPGPATPTPAMRRILALSPLPHRSPRVREAVRSIKSVLMEETGCTELAVLAGGGTLANEAVAANLAALRQPGVIVSNGEFGERLAQHAAGWSLDVRHIKGDWGEPLPWAEVDLCLEEDSNLAWIWFVHGETSTSMVNRIAEGRDRAARYGLRLCIDCVSTLGAVDIDLSGVWLASGVSSKFLLGLHGLAFLFTDSEEPLSLEAVPPSFSLARFCLGESLPFSIGSSLVLLLEDTLAQRPMTGLAERRASACDRVEAFATGLGLPVLCQDQPRIPGLTTLALGSARASENLGNRLAEAGYETNFRSSYLAVRGWLQIAFIWPPSRAQLDRFLGTIGDAMEVVGLGVDRQGPNSH